MFEIHAPLGAGVRIQVFQKSVKHLQPLIGAQFDDAPSRNPEPRRTQSATKSLFSGFSFVGLRALCGGRFGKMSHYPAIRKTFGF
jgi:hypothetical protein